MSNNPMLAPASAGNVPRAHYGDQQLAKILAAASNNATLLKGAAAGSLEEVAVFNTTAAAIYIKFFDKATIPVPGTDTPAFTLQIPANGSCIIAGGLAKPFVNGVGYAITANAADNDNTSVTAGSVLGFLLWS
jgi:hypothetical protein